MKYQKVHPVYPCITAQFPQYFVLQVLKVLKCIEPLWNLAKLMLMVPYSPFFPFWWWGTSGDHPKKDLGSMATSYWKTLKKVENLVEKPHLMLNASNLSKSGELFFEVLSNSVKFLRICKNIIFFKLFWVQFCISSLGKKVALVYSVAFYFFWWYIAQMRKSKFKFFFKKSDFEGLH
jgi:hypothetical protein